MKIASAISPLQARWRALGVREQTLIRRAALLLGLALLWWVLLAPPLRTLRQADAQQLGLDAQLQKMQSLQAQAKVLQSQPKISRSDALRTLETSVKQQLGATAQFNATGDRATITLQNTPATALSQWLAQARVNARVVPSEVRLVRAAAANNAPGPTGSVGPIATVAWDGTLVMSLPAE